MEGNVLTVHDPEFDVDLNIRDRPTAEPNYAVGDHLCEASCMRQVSPRLYNEAQQNGVLSARKEAVAKANQDLFNAANRALRIVRWRRGYNTHHEPIRTTTLLHWSLDGSQWVEATDVLHGFITMGPGRWHWSEDMAHDILQLISQRESEPIGHDLYVEAAALEQSNPRSAILLAVAAAEVGFKQFAIRLRPETRWIFENASSPPLILMLSEFLPTLPLRQKLQNQSEFVPSSLLEILKKAVLIRNEIVHRGEHQRPHFETVNEILHAVRDLLYLLDFYSGYSWAIGNLDSPIGSPRRKNTGRASAPA
jgi:hypothetical protein